MHKQSTKEGAIKDTDFDITKFGDEGFGFKDIQELSRQGYGKQQIQDYVDHLRKGKVQVHSCLASGRWGAEGPK